MPPVMTNRSKRLRVEMESSRSSSRTAQASVNVASPRLHMRTHNVVAANHRPRRYTAALPILQQSIMSHRFGRIQPPRRERCRECLP